MNMKKIYAICKILDAGTDYEKQQVINNGIKVGDKIELENACVEGWSTEVWLVGYETSFNSVFFDFVDENGEDYDIYHDKDFQSYW